MINKRKLLFQQHLVELLSNHQPFDDQEKYYVEKSLPFCRVQPKCADRENVAGHVTTSAWILSPNKDSVLLINNRKYGKWLQPGGHIESIDNSIQLAAKRIAEEETDLEGLMVVSDRLFDVDLHIIPETEGEPKHWHIDFRFLLMCATMPPAIHLTSNNLAWHDLNAIASRSDDNQLTRLAVKSLNFFEQSVNQKKVAFS